MKTVAMNRAEWIYQRKLGWNVFLESVKRDMLQGEKRKAINDMIKKLPTSDEKPVTINRRKAFYFL